MQILINLSAEEINALKQTKEIRDEHDVIFCVHELISKNTAKKAECATQHEDMKIGSVTFAKGTKIYKCPICGEWLTRTQKYCSNCGQEILWEVKNE